MRLVFTADPGNLRVENISAENEAALAQVFGLQKAGDIVRLQRSDILGRPDSVGNRPILGFELQAFPKEQAVLAARDAEATEIEEPATPKKRAKKGGK
jgi:hypothetical protein